MPFRELSLLDIVCEPIVEEKLTELEPWLYSGSESLFPLLCETPVIQPRVDTFLAEQQWHIVRAFAELGEKPDVSQWYFSRYGSFNPPDPPPMDTEIKGEGYPGFWEAVEAPSFLDRLDLALPEELILDTIDERTYPLGLDLGCGQGGMMQLMAQRCRRVLGLETNFYLAATANHLLRSREIPIRYFVPEKGFQTTVLEKEACDHASVICGDVLDMPFCEPLFDWIHCGHVLDLVDEPERILAQAIRIMKPGALLTICTPWDFVEPGHFDEMLDLLASDFKEIHRTDGIPWLRYGHKRRFVLHEDWLWIGKLSK